MTMCLTQTHKYTQNSFIELFEYVLHGGKKIYDMDTGYI